MIAEYIATLYDAGTRAPIAVVNTSGAWTDILGTSRLVQSNVTIVNDGLTLWTILYGVGITFEADILGYANAFGVRLWDETGSERPLELFGGGVMAPGPLGGLPASDAIWKLQYQYDTGTGAPTPSSYYLSASAAVLLMRAQ